MLGHHFVPALSSLYFTRVLIITKWRRSAEKASDDFEQDDNIAIIITNIIVIIIINSTLECEG